MSQYVIHPGLLKGHITIPASKSQTLRAILFASLGDGKSLIHHYLPSPDTQAMIDACSQLGAVFNPHADTLEIHGIKGKVRGAKDVINAGNSGIVLRFCAAVGALAPRPVVITGDHSIRYQRPMGDLLDGLTKLGVSATSMRGDQFAPVIIQGPIKPGRTTLVGQDSQPVSGLLIASAFADGPIEIEVQHPGEKPWVGLTLSWLDRLGISYQNQNFEHYRLNGKSHYPGFNYTVPGDLSSLAFPIAAALVTGSELTIENVDTHDPQGDKALIEVFREMGAEIDIDDMTKVLHVKGGAQLQGVRVDINNFIDSITILAVVACYAMGETYIENAAIAKQKECNRPQSIAKELKKMGANIIETTDGLRIVGSPLKGTSLYSYADHRMAMSLSVAALGAAGPSTIFDVDCVAKTFPSFVKDFQQLGGHIEERR